MTHPTTATETEAAAQRAAHTIMLETRAMLGGEFGWLGTNRIEAIIAAEIAPLLARAEAADKLAEAVYAHTQEGKLYSVDYCQQCNEIMLSLAAYRALAAQEAKP